MKKKFIRILLTLMLTVSFVLSLSISASAYYKEYGRGNCGVNGENDDSVTWAVIEYTGSGGVLLFIEGKGEMEGFAFWASDRGRYAPWWDWQDKIEGVVIEDGITNIGRNALRELPNLKALEIPGSVKRIDYCGVYNCQNLKKVIMHEGLETIGDYAFEYDYALEEIILPSTLKSIGEEAFYDDSNLKNVWYYGDDWNDVTIGEDNNPLTSLASQGKIKCQDQILDYDYWVTDGTYHWHESKSDAPYWFTGPKETHYDYYRNRDGICDICGAGILDTSRSLKYLDETGTLTTATSDVQYLNGKETELTDGWYAVGAEIDFGNTRLKISGDVKLILQAWCGMTVKRGIEVPGGSTLTVYSDVIALEESSQNMGYIRVTEPDMYCAGIGSNHNGSGGKAVFYGGRIEAKGGDYSAGIGSGNAFGFTVEIHNGFIKANGGYGGAGIGSGYGQNADCWILIDGGYVEAHGGTEAAGIGAGSYAHADVNISGGIIRAWGGYGGAGIGAGEGCWVTPTTIKLSGNPDIEAHGGEMNPDENRDHLSKADDIGAGLNSKWTLEDTRGNNLLGFTLSGGNWWVLGIGAVIILGGIAAILLVFRKKKQQI